MGSNPAICFTWLVRLETMGQTRGEIVETEICYDMDCREYLATRCFLSIGLIIDDACEREVHSAWMPGRLAMGHGC